MWNASSVGLGECTKYGLELIDVVWFLCVLCTIAALSTFILEPNWHVMHDRLQTAKSIDEVIQHHDFFLDKCLKECLLLLPELIKNVEKLKSLCLQYAAATQWLISSSINIPKLDEQSDGSVGSGKSKQWKLKNPSQAQKAVTRNSAVTDSIL
ncbi:hypothetical protein GOBAR_AA30386 [Gossypium barbadense]|uniref:Gamma-tubulin complex component n=1 Tax=Gossypium barbadense TaxID=3634 RepID=A0A2P5WGS6_GOSBA|nr:hypothetical protein GOBAR_AA30386 [Gossypium barbadense]